MAGDQNPRKQAKIATGCHQLPETFHGKEGVDGSSPSEGSAKGLHSGCLSRRATCSSFNMRWVWSPLWSLQVENFFCGSGREPSLAVIESRRKVADLMVAFGTTIGLRFVSADPEERSYIERV